MDTSARYRYPGINFFTKDDHDIFCGRSVEADRLFTGIMSSNTMVLHGESGTGKSSLVQAGILPLLEERNKKLATLGKPKYLEVTIRLDSLTRSFYNHKDAEENDLLLRATLYNIDDDLGNRYLAKYSLPYINPRYDSLWYTTKLFELNNYTLLLIFDQFEELQGFDPEKRRIFAQRLSELFVSSMPPEIYDEYSKKTTELLDEKELTDEARKELNENIKFLEQPLSVRVLFIIREDRLGTMSLLADFFPDILKSNFFLAPLNKKGATMAIEEPAKKEGNFVSGKFSFDPDALEYLLTNLEEKEKSDRYDPFQLQIVCGSIEKSIRDNSGKIRKKDIRKVDDIISEFYNDIWREIRSDFKLSKENFGSKRKEIIKELVFEGRRNLVLENKLINIESPVGEKIIAALVEKGLLKKISSENKTVFYQLTHDRLMEPVVKDLQNLEANEKVQKETEEERRRLKDYKTQIDNSTVISFDALKRLIGTILILLPLLLVIGKLVAEKSLQLEYSISDYYDNKIAGDILTGILFVLGFLLFSYRGYAPIDSIAANFGCAFALGAALFPATSPNKFVHYAHFIFALWLFFDFIFFAIYLFRKTNPNSTAQKEKRNTVYLICGVIMLICLLGIPIFNLFPAAYQLNMKFNIIFWLESLLFFSAGLSWLTKGGLILKDEADYYYRRPRDKFYV